MEFKSFPKIPRLSRETIITEKIDGTNGIICITRHQFGKAMETPATPVYIKNMNDATYYYIYAGSRNKWIHPGQDNAGFAAWVHDNGEELLKLGEGYHYGEWWGKGIQRGYGLNEKRFSLFNTSLWNEDTKPECCYVVPVLWTGIFNTFFIESMITHLQEVGSYAAPGFMQPEGIVVYHVPSGYMFKKTIENDESPKGKINE